jgi:acetone carboxylase gamma subunit
MSHEFVCPDCGAVYEVVSGDVRDAAVVCWDDGTACVPVTGVRHAR